MKKNKLFIIFNLFILLLSISFLVSGINIISYQAKSGFYNQVYVTHEQYILITLIEGIILSIIGTIGLFVSIVFINIKLLRDEKN